MIVFLALLVGVLFGSAVYLMLRRSIDWRSTACTVTSTGLPSRQTASRTSRSAAPVHEARFRECVALQAQYVYDTFGKFPGTVPSVFVMMYLQAHHLDLEFYDEFYNPGAYLRTHAMHIQQWHADDR